MKGKYSKRRGVASKTLVLALAVMLIVGTTIGGTIAWLTAESGTVTNTFTTSDINITLSEGVDTDKDGAASFKMVPGCTITKDPKASVVTGSEDCYLFVEITESENFNNFMTYAIAEGWTKLGNSNVYYRVYDSKDSNNTNQMGTQYSILDGDRVVVKDSVTKEHMNGLTENTYPKLTFKAYAVQLYKNNTEKFQPAEAWDNRPTT